MTTTEPIEINITYTKDHISTFFIRNTLLNLLNGIANYFLIYLGFTFIVGQRFTFYWEDLQYFSVGCCLVFVMNAWAAYQGSFGFYQNQGMESNWVFTDEKLTVKYPKSGITTEIPWKRIITIIKKKNIWIIYIAKTTAIVLPIDSITPDLETFLNNKIAEFNIPATTSSFKQKIF